MYHPFFGDEAWEVLTASTPWGDGGGACVEGVGAAAAIFMRDLEHRSDRIISVDLAEGEGGEEEVVLAFGAHDRLRMPVTRSFAPFPFVASDLLRYRARNFGSMRRLCLAASQLLREADIVWLPWLGFLRFWTEAASDVYRRVAGAAPLDILVPSYLEEALLGLAGTLRRDPRSGLFLYVVEPSRLVQLSLNHLPELGDGVDLRHVCPSCTVLNIFFIGGDGSLTTDAPPCTLSMDGLSLLEAFRDGGRWETEMGLMSEPILAMLKEHGPGYFTGRLQRPCSLPLSSFPDVESAAHLGELSRALASETWDTAASGELLVNVPWTAPAPAASGPRYVVPSSNFSREVAALDGAAGWFAFMESRMTARRPGLALFQAKLFMKKLMTERGAPIPRLLHASSRSPELPFGPPLPLLPGGYVVKPAHLAESAHVFVIDAEGTDLLTGRQPTWEEVQGNMTEAWGKSLAHYDQAQGEGGDEQCARSKRYGRYLQGRSCSNWALYRCPPGVLVEELVTPSSAYDALQGSAFRDQGLGIMWRRQPDEIKCHVVWGKLFVAEWVSSGAFLGFIFRHGFVKDSIVLGPQTLRMCWDTERPEGQVCAFQQMWEYVRFVAERAAPPGVDYLRVDIFPNGDDPVVNELSVGGYATMLEEWMLDELMRRVKEGYVLRGFSPDPADYDEAATGD